MSIDKTDNENYWEEVRGEPFLPYEDGAAEKFAEYVNDAYGEIMSRDDAQKILDEVDFHGFELCKSKSNEHKGEFVFVSQDDSTDCEFYDLKAVLAEVRLWNNKNIYNDIAKNGDVHANVTEYHFLLEEKDIEALPKSKREMLRLLNRLQSRLPLEADRFSDIQDFQSYVNIKYLNRFLSFEDSKKILGYQEGHGYRIAFGENGCLVQIDEVEKITDPVTFGQLLGDAQIWSDELDEEKDNEILAKIGRQISIIDPDDLVEKKEQEKIDRLSENIEHNGKDDRMENYEIGLWSGAGYTLNTFGVRARSDEEALEKTVAYIIDKGYTGLYASGDDVRKLKEDDEKDGEEIDETWEERHSFLYVDATMEVAPFPVYLNSENMKIQTVEKFGRDIEIVKESEREAEKKASEKNAATNFVLEKLAEAGIEVVTDKAGFERMLATEEILQKKSEGEKLDLFATHNNEKLNEEINSLTINDVNVKNKYINIADKTPFIFKECGLDEHPVKMYKQKLARAFFLEKEKPGERRTHGHKGEFSIQTAEETFAQLGNPRFVFNSKKNITNPDDYYLIGVYDKFDNEGNPMMLSLRYNRNDNNIEANWVQSIYGRRKNDVIYGLAEGGYLLYANDIEMEKASAETCTLYMRVMAAADAYVSNIIKKSHFVNELGINFYKIGETTYGFTHNNKIYLNPDVMNSEAAVHEYTHLWDAYTQRTNPELWQKGKDTFSKTHLWDEVKNDSNYANITNDDNLVLSEIHARITGKIAEQVLERIAKEDGEITKESVINWDKEIWDYIQTEIIFTEQDISELDKTVADSEEISLHSILHDVKDFLSMPMKDLLNGKNITKESEKQKEESMEDKKYSTEDKFNMTTDLQDPVVKFNVNHETGHSYDKNLNLMKTVMKNLDGEYAEGTMKQLMQKDLKNNLETFNERHDTNFSEEEIVAFAKWSAEQFEYAYKNLYPNLELTDKFFEKNDLEGNFGNIHLLEALNEIAGEIDGGFEIRGIQKYAPLEADPSKENYLIEYEGIISEDYLFNRLSEMDIKDGTSGLSIDPNPILPEKSGTIDEYLDRLEQWRKEDMEKSEEKSKNTMTADISEIQAKGAKLARWVYQEKGMSREPFSTKECLPMTAEEGAQMVRLFNAFGTDINTEDVDAGRIWLSYNGETKKDGKIFYEDLLKDAKYYVNNPSHVDLSSIEDIPYKDLVKELEMKLSGTQYVEREKLSTNTNLGEKLSDRTKADILHSDSPTLVHMAQSDTSEILPKESQKLLKEAVAHELANRAEGAYQAGYQKTKDTRIDSGFLEFSEEYKRKAPSKMELIVLDEIAELAEDEGKVIYVKDISQPLVSSIHIDYEGKLSESKLSTRLNFAINEDSELRSENGYKFKFIAKNENPGNYIILSHKNDEDIDLFRNFVNNGLYKGEEILSKEAAKMILLEMEESDIKIGLGEEKDTLYRIEHGVGVNGVAATKENSIEGFLNEIEEWNDEIGDDEYIEKDEPDVWRDYLETKRLVDETKQNIDWYKEMKQPKQAKEKPDRVATLKARAVSATHKFDVEKAIKESKQKENPPEQQKAKPDDRNLER